MEDMIREFEGYRWDAVLVNETWRTAKSEIWETHQRHIFTGARKYENKHEVGILLNKKWRNRINDTECFSEPATATTITVNHQRIMLMSVYFLYSEYADHHIENMYRTIEKHTNSSMKSVQFVVGDLERTHKRGDWMKQWLMIQIFTALDTMYRKKTPGKQATYRSPEGTEKQTYYILIQRRHLRYSKDAEANDMIHMGSDHRCVMATFVINTPKQDGSHDTKNKLRRITTENIRTQTVEKMETKKHQRSKKDITNSKKRSNKKDAAANSDLKQNEP